MNELVPVKMGTSLYLVEADSICQFTLSEVFMADEPQETLIVETRLSDSRG